MGLGSRILRLVLLFVILSSCLVFGSTGSPVYAQSADYALQIEDLGQAPTLRLSGAVSERTFSIPVHPGLQPATFDSRVYTVPGITAGLLTFESNGTTLLTLALPLQQPQIIVPLAEATVQRGRMNLTIRAILNPGQARCAAELIQWIELSKIVINFSGQATPPQTLADFWPPDLRELNFYTSTTPNPAEAEALLNFTTFAARLSSSHPVTITVNTLDPAAPLPPVAARPASRTILVRGNEAATSQRLVTPVEGGWPLLQVSGSPQTLPGAVEALTSPTRALLLSPNGNVSAPPLTPATTRPNSSQRTFEQLGFPQIQMQGSGQLETSLNFTQADLNGPVSEVAVRLVGTYSPIPTGGVASLAVLLNSGLVQAAPLEREGRFDMFMQIPASLLRRDNTLTVRLLYTPPGGDCRVGVHDIIVRLDGGSYLEGQFGQKIAPGFDRFPQSLLPEFNVTFDQITSETLLGASQTLAAMQRITRTPLRIKVVSWEQAQNIDNSRPLMAVVLDPARAAVLQPPLDPSPFRLLDSDRRELLRLEVEAKFAVLEAYNAQNRDILLLTHRDLPQGITTLTGNLNQKNGWYELTGDIWLQANGQLPFNVRLRDSGLRIQPLPDTPQVWWEKVSWLIYVLAFAAIVFFLFWAYPRVVRRGPTNTK